MEERLPLWILKDINFMLNKAEPWVTQECRFVFLSEVCLAIRLVWVTPGFVFKLAKSIAAMEQHCTSVKAALRSSDCLDPKP